MGRTGSLMGALLFTPLFIYLFYFADRYGPARARTRVICKQIYLLVFNILQLFTLMYSGGRKKPQLLSNNHHPNLHINLLFCLSFIFVFDSCRYFGDPPSPPPPTHPSSTRRRRMKWLKRADLHPPRCDRWERDSRCRSTSSPSLAAEKVI